MIAVAGMTRVARMAGVPVVTCVSAMTVVVKLSVFGVVHGLSAFGVARFSRPHTLMILLLVHASNVYPSGV